MSAQQVKEEGGQAVNAVSDFSMEDIGSTEIMAHKFLSFTSSQEAYAVSISRVKEIIEYEVVTRVPMVPDYIRGVMNLRGSVVPVIDLPARLGRSPGEPGKKSCIVIVEVVHDDESIDLGLSVDAVNEVLDIREESIEQAPLFGADIREDFIDAMGLINDDFMVLLNVDTVLSIDELSQLGDLRND